jgi:OOP family OmpA-OmpF porin
MRTFLKSIFVAIILCASVAEISAQTATPELVTYNLTLKNKRTSEPISGANVGFKRLPYESEVGSLTTDAQGKVTMYFRAEDQYSLLVAPDGYIKISEIVDPKSGASSNMVNDVTINMIEGGIGSVLTLDNVNFAQGKAVFTDESYPSLDNLVEMLTESSSMSIQLEGHTDFRGSPTANLQLSQARVDAVKEYLVSKGIASSRITTKAFGGSQPVTRDNSAEARAKNRRVEVRIISD